MDYTFVDGRLCAIPEGDSPLDFKWEEWDIATDIAGFSGETSFGGEYSNGSVELLMLRDWNDTTWPYRFMADWSWGSSCFHVFLADLPEVFEFLRYVAPILTLGWRWTQKEEADERRRENDLPARPYKPTEEEQQKRRVHRKAVTERTEVQWAAHREARRGRASTEPPQESAAKQ